MPDAFLDTNIIIRYATQDHPRHAERALAYLQRLEVGEETATTCEGVIVEAVQVLESKRLYNYPRGDIREALRGVIQLRGLQLVGKSTYLRALDIYATTPLDFVDTLNVAHMERLHVETIVTFDQGYDRVPTIKRREP